MKLNFTLALSFVALSSIAQNPIVQTIFSTDPAPMVEGDTLYVYTGHDEDNADFFWMNDWHIYSTTDMVNWRDRGVPLSLESFSWADDRAWAAQCIKRNGKFYWYVCAHSKLTNAMAIGVAIGDTPIGPFKDAIGKPLVDGDWAYIDPTVLIDDDGQAYLYWGNPELFYVKLNNDMISYEGDVKHFEQTIESFGAPEPALRNKDTKYKDTYVEGPWISKRNNKYYMLYAAGGVPEHIAYSMAEKPLGPWTYMGEIMPLENTESFTNHCGVVDYKGNSYFFYHTGHLPKGGGFGRSVAVEQFEYLPDGRFPLIHHTNEGIIKPLGTLNPYERIEAETMAFSCGVHTEMNGQQVYVSDIHPDDYIKLREVDFGTEGAEMFKMSAASGLMGGVLQIHIDSIAGELVGEFEVNGTQGWQNWSVFGGALSKKIIGKHDVFFTFKGRYGLKGQKLMNIDWWQFVETRDLSFRNPILYADVPDMALCYANGFYYMVSTTMHLMPGAPIMRSKDMKTWEIVSYVFDSINDGDRYNLKGSTVYGQGQWASSIRYHNGKFYVWFTANGVPGKGFIFSADKAEGPWTLVARPPHHHDASLFFDEDGRVYLFHGSGSCTVTELSPDLSDCLEGGLNKTLIANDPEERGGLLEGSQVFKHKGKYYICMISMHWGIPGRVRREVCYRADNIAGPYEKKIILETPFECYGGAGQGCVVNGSENDNDETNWWALMFQDRGGVGRVPCLVPCKWIDGWPILGDDEGKIPNDYSKEYFSFNGIVGSDEFESDKLNLYWQWNHNPEPSAWSLSERPGFLRLKTSRIVDNVFVAPNTLTQRMTGPRCSASVCIDFSKMKEGDVAGFSAYNGDSGVLAIEKAKKGAEIVASYQKTIFGENHDIKNVEIVDVERHQISGNIVYFRIDADFENAKDEAIMYYSTDGTNWNKIGQTIKLVFDYRRMFMGSKYAIFNYSTKRLGGYIDVDWFHFKQETK